MQNEIVINADLGETRVALLERSIFSELHIERSRDQSVVGNVVKGRVSRVLPGMQAAFVDIGLDKAAFLYVGDYFAATADGEDGELKRSPRQGRGRGGRGRGNQRNIPKIESVLQEGQEIVVQIAKEPIGSKGARITSNISIPGRHLVLTPWAKRVGVSRRIDSDRERRRLRQIVEKLRTSDLGFIIRTAGDGVREADIEADIRYLTTVWQKISERNLSEPAPSVLYTEPDLPLRMIRDFANPETKRITIDSEEVFESIKTFVDQYVADPKPKIEHYKGNAPIFDHFELEAQVHANLERKVWLKSGGHLVIDQSEALTSIDVNTGRYIGKRDLEETVFRTNLEAIKEVVYQLRFRNIGGLIIIDLIDMESAANREKVYRALQEALRHDKARTNILKISELGLVEMTRKRTRENLVQTLCEPCSYCEGRGYILSRESVAFRILREIRKDLPHFCGRQIAVTVSPQVAEALLTSDRQSLTALGEELGREIEVRARPGLHQEQFEVTALDAGNPIDIPLRWLRAEREEEAPAKSRRSRGGRGRGQRGQENGSEQEISAREEERLAAAAELDGELDGELDDGADDFEDDFEDGSAASTGRGARSSPPEGESSAAEDGRLSDLEQSMEDGADASDEVEKPLVETSPADDAGQADATRSDSVVGKAAAALADEARGEGEETRPVSLADAPDALPKTAQAIDEEAESRILPGSEKHEDQ